MELTAGIGRPLIDVYNALFGSTKSAKAIRKLSPLLLPSSVTMTPEIAELWPSVVPAIHMMAQSQAFKQVLGGAQSPYWDRFFVNYRPNDLLPWLRSWIWDFDTLKKLMARQLRLKPAKLTASTRKLLTAWVSNNSGPSGRFSTDEIAELEPFRPPGARIYYRGIRFSDIGSMVAFHERFASGKAFPFESKRFSSWTTSKVVAERFGRYSASETQNTAMFGFLSRMKAKKDYDGWGGYVIGAKIAPSQILVDLTHPGLEKVEFQHGNEGEIILMPDVRLTTKVYSIFGDIEREIAEFNERKAPDSPLGNYFRYTFRQNGDANSGELVFSPLNDWETKGKPNLPRFLIADEVKSALSKNLYYGEWVDDFTVIYRRMRRR
jgi:hypothetical protein